MNDLLVTILYLILTINLRFTVFDQSLINIDFKEIFKNLMPQPHTYDKR